MIVALQIIAALAVVFGVAVLLTGRDAMSEELADAADIGLPRDRPLRAQDVARLRFALVFRGYRMSEVDEALDRIAAELGRREAEIEELHAALDDALSGAGRPAAAARTSASPFAPPAPEPETRAAPVAAEVDVPEPVAAEGEVPEPVAAGVEVPEPAVEDVEVPEPERAPAAVPVPPPIPVPPPVSVPPPAPAVIDAGAGSDLPDVPAPDSVPEPAAQRDEVDDTAAAPASRPVEEGGAESAYSPWAVRPQSRYAVPPTWLDVDSDMDDQDVVSEHQTGHAPPAPTGEPGPGEGEDEPRPGSPA